VFRLPAEVLALNLPKEETMRQNVVYEILESEADYVRDLNVMINVSLNYNFLSALFTINCCFEIVAHERLESKAYFGRQRN
jgi:hypothetical protein